MRLKLLGHLFRQPMDHPANTVMNQYFLNLDRANLYRGRSPTSLPRILNEKFQHINFQFTNNGHHQHFRGIAQDRRKWNEIISCILAKKKKEPSVKKHVKRLENSKRRKASQDSIVIMSKDQTKRLRISLTSKPRKRAAEEADLGEPKVRETRLRCS